MLCAALGLPAGAAAQTAVDTVGTRAAGAQLHPVVGVMGGVFDLDGGPRLDVLGARAGLGFGELFRLTGFYWRSVDTGERELLDGRGWGGEARLNLSAGFGLTPFVTAGLGRVRVDTLEDELDDATVDDRTAAILGAGLMVPLGPVQVSVGARDYILGLSGLDDSDESAEATHNWLFSVGVSASLGRTRGREPITVARAPRPGLVDTVFVDARGQPLPPDTVRVDARGEPVEPGVRNYQSDRQIAVPIPLEGSITLRYGPEAVASGAAAAGSQAAAGRTPAGEVGATREPASPEPVQPQVAPVLSEAALQRIIDGTVAALLPRLEARDVERQNRLRADLSAALAGQREAVRQAVQQELARLGVAPRATAPPAATAEAPAAPPAPADLEDEIQRAAARLAAARAELARIEAARADPAGGVEPAPPVQPAAPDIRPVLVDLAARNAPLLATAELERGPALVLADLAFEAGSALLDERARVVLGAVAAALRAVPGRPIFVQGHADAAGPEVQNQQLSELRAEVVRSLLVQAGVEPGRVHAVGFGAGRPVAPNETAAGRALNRRVEIVIGETEADGGTR